MLVVLAGLLDGADRRRPPRSAATMTASSRLLIVLWDCAVMRGRLSRPRRGRRSSGPPRTSCRSRAAPGSAARRGRARGRGVAQRASTILARLAPARGHRPAGRAAAARRSSMSRTARYGPSPSMPSAMTASATRSSAPALRLALERRHRDEGDRMRPLGVPAALQLDQSRRRRRSRRSCRHPCRSSRSIGWSPGSKP